MHEFSAITNETREGIAVDVSTAYPLRVLNQIQPLARLAGLQSVANTYSMVTIGHQKSDARKVVTFTNWFSGIRFVKMA
jgi:hypothetical protein